MVKILHGRKDYIKVRNAVIQSIIFEPGERVYISDVLNGLSLHMNVTSNMNV